MNKPLHVVDTRVVGTSPTRSLKVVRWSDGDLVLEDYLGVRLIVPCGIVRELARVLLSSQEEHEDVH